MKKKYLFIDRDGTLIDEPVDDQQVDSLEKLRFEPNVIPALLKLRARGYLFVMITNQDGLGTESFPVETFEIPHERMLDMFESQGILFEEILVCPHIPSDNCACRKPNMGLVRKYLTDRAIDREKSAVIGDRESDIQLAENMGLRGIRYNRTTNTWQSIAADLSCARRTSVVERKTSETEIKISVDLDDTSKNEIHTGIRFFDHMLDQVATHGGFNLRVDVTGDVDIDDHHSIEDTGIVLGEALKNALGDKIGIGRFGFSLPMDDSDATCLIDLSGRAFLKFEAKFSRDKLGEMSTEMVPHFFRSLSHSLAATIHLKADGENTHHKVEALFKSFGRSLRQAIRVSDSRLPSSKGVL